MFLPQSKKRHIQSSMKTIYFLTTIAILEGCAGQGLQPEKVIDFRGATLGSSPLPDMRVLEKWYPKMGLNTREISDAYMRSSEPKMLGELSINDVIYEYFNQKLFRVEISLWTEKQKRCPKSDEIVAALQSQYAISMTWHQQDYVKNQFLAQWSSPQARVTYMCFPFNTTNSIILESPLLQRELETKLKAIKSTNEMKAAEKIKKALQ
jgi:hypothetical protein